jgi:hypothetical protein
MKPIKYRLILGQLSNTQTDSLKVLASVMFYVGRLAVKSTPRILVCNKKKDVNQFFLFIGFAT